MSSQRITLEHALYILAFILALTLRLLNLGDVPLNDYEADWALQSLSVVQGDKPLLGPNPGYILLSAVSFFVFGASNFWARFWPAMTGSLMVLAPWFFRNRLGRIPAILLAFCLVFDPGLLAMSRFAGGPILAIAFFTLAWAMWEARRWPLVGVFGGLALLSGPALYGGLLSLGIAVGIWQIFQRRKSTRVENDDSAILAGVDKRQLVELLGWGLGTLLLGGTLFLFTTNGLSALAAGISTYVSGWWTPSAVPASHLLIAIPAYAPLALIFGLVAVVRSWREGGRRTRQLGFWVLVALMLVLVYPARQVADLIWVLLPLYTLAACELACHFKTTAAGSWALIGASTLTLVVLAFSWVDLAGIAGVPFAMDVTQTRLQLLIGAVILLVFSLLLIGVGWSGVVARRGLVYGAGIALAVFTIGAAFGAAGLREPQTVELWQPAPQTAQADLLLQTIEEFSDWRRGRGEALSLVSHGVDSPALRWLLRDLEIKEISVLSSMESPDAVITPQDVDLSLTSPYRGQAFVWYQSPAWEAASGEDWLRWFVFRKMYQYSENLNLWVREDLFLESEDQVLE